MSLRPGTGAKADAAAEGADREDDEQHKSNEQKQPKQLESPHPARAEIVSIMIVFPSGGAGAATMRHTAGSLDAAADA